MIALEIPATETPTAQPTVVDDLSARTQRLDESKGVEGELRETISLLTAALESTAAGILIVDEAGRIIGLQ